MHGVGRVGNGTRLWKLRIPQGRAERGFVLVVALRVEGWARRRSFVGRRGGLLWMTAKGGLGGRTRRLGEAERFLEWRGLKV